MCVCVCVCVCVAREKWSKSVAQIANTVSGQLTHHVCPKAAGVKQSNTRTAGTNHTNSQKTET